jgi:hypothetical protein
MHAASVPAPAAECHTLRPTRAHSHPPVARAVIPVGFCFVLRERACADHQTLRSHVVVDSCRTKPSAKTWAALAVTVAEGARSAEAEQGAPRASHDVRLFRPHP